MSPCAPYRKRTLQPGENVGQKLFCSVSLCLSPQNWKFDWNEIFVLCITIAAAAFSQNYVICNSPKTSRSFLSRIWKQATQNEKVPHAEIFFMPLQSILPSCPYAPYFSHQTRNPLSMRSEGFLPLIELSNQSALSYFFAVYTIQPLEKYSRKETVLEGWLNMMSARERRNALMQCWWHTTKVHVCGNRLFFRI